MEMEMEMEGGQWCNICCNMVNPFMNNEGENKCPVCGTEFTEVIGSLRDHSNSNNNEGIDLRSPSVFSLYAPILLGLMTAFSPSLATIASTSNINSHDYQQHHHELVLGRRRRTSSSLMLIFRRLHDRMVSESENTPQNNRNNNNNNNNNNNDNMNLNVVVIEPFNEEALILRGPSHHHHHHMNQTRASPTENPVGSLGDFLDGPGFGLLLQQLGQNEPNRFVTNNVNPPAHKAAIEAMPTVKIQENNIQCIICLEDTEIGNEVKEMPCKHKFHSDCIISWLKLHSSCPVCRFQMPSDDSKVETTFEHRNDQANHQNINNDDHQDQVVAREERIMRFGRSNWLSILQPFDHFLP